MFDITVPQRTERLQFSLDRGETLFVLGANGTGKSSLVHHIYAQHDLTSHRISAHRQTWLPSGRLELTSYGKKDAELSIQRSDIQPQSRWQEHYGGVRSNVAIYNIIQRQHSQNRDIASAARLGDSNLALALAKEQQDPVVILNRLLAHAGLPIVISVRDDEEIIAINRGSQPYSIVELSDGERNVLLLTAEILTAPDGMLILIDEPERHLHRSIISPLLTELFAERPDCTFVLSTHDIGLVLDHPLAKILLVRGCEYAGQSVAHWDVDYIDSHTADAIDDDLKYDILGARSDVLFVEGGDASLDRPLYSLALPSVSVISKGNCRDVEHAVTSIRQAESLHWLRAFGIVDNDGRNAQDIEHLKSKGIYAIDAYTVESIYYDPQLQMMLAHRLWGVDSNDVQARIDRANNAAINAIGTVADQLAKRAAQRRLHVQHMSYLPTKQNISFEAPINISLNAPDVLAEEQERLDRALKNRDIASLIRRYPIKNTDVLPRIAGALGFRDRRAYEQAVLKLLKEDRDALELVRGLLGGLPEAIASRQPSC